MAVIHGFEENKMAVLHGFETFLKRSHDIGASSIGVHF
jgi:hypothetical protein